MGKTADFLKHHAEKKRARAPELQPEYLARNPAPPGARAATAQG